MVLYVLRQDRLRKRVLRSALDDIFGVEVLFSKNNYGFLYLFLHTHQVITSVGRFLDKLYHVLSSPFSYPLYKLSFSAHLYNGEREKRIHHYFHFCVTFLINLHSLLL